MTAAFNFAGWAGEPVRYNRPDNYFANNGHRRHLLALGKRRAAVINAARRGDFDTVVAAVRSLGGVSGGIGIARDIVRLAAKLPADVAGHRIIREGSRMTVAIPEISWEYRGNRQRGVISEVRMFGN